MTADWPPEGVDLVHALHDAKLVLSQRAFQWSLGAPTLEDDTGAVSIGQDELGHVRQLARQLQRQGLDPRELRGHRDGSAFRNPRPLDEPKGTWARFLVPAALADRAAWLLLDAVQHDDLHGLVQRMGEDEWFHLEYLDARLEALADDDPDLVQRALAEDLPGVLAFLGPADHDGTADPLVTAGFTDRPVSELRQFLLAHLDDLLEATPVDPTKVDRTGPDPDAWDPARRRVGGGGPDDELLRQLRGDLNERYAIR